MSRYLIAAAVLVCATACGRPPLLEISIVGAPAPTAIEVSGLPRADLAALAGATLTRDRWQQIFTVSVAGAAGPVVGDYTIVDATVRFTPMYGLDAGRSFDVTFDASRIPGADPGDNWRRPPLKNVVSVAGRALARTTVVEHVYPSGGEVTANMLRFYIEFSAPMGRGSALDHIRLVDDAGQEVVEPFLPVDAELWTPDHTRFTLLFDPGRVKRGIKPNRDLGRALIPGKRYALTIGEDWLDGRGEKLRSGHRHEFSVRPPIEQPLDASRWQLEVPRAGTLDPLTVTFPWALDYGLLKHALNVRRGAVELDGEISLGPFETRWRFTPRVAWVAGDHALVALTLLEDPAGNRLGRGFEVMESVGEEKESVEIGFRVR